MNNFLARYFVLAVMLFGCIAPRLYAQQPKPGAPATTESGGTSAASGAPVVVTRSFLRMHHPDVLVSLARQVKAGGSTQADLVRLAGPNFANVLLNADLGQSPDRKKR